MALRGVRGATVVAEDQKELILSATKELLQAIQNVNPTLRPEDIASCIFTTTNDITSEFPAKAAREMGWNQVPMMCAQEIPVPHSLQKCIRVLIHWNTDLKPQDIHHVYLHEAQVLRPEWVYSNFEK
ncbi:MAG: chorismate mutase [Anaerolineales bacterium]